MSDQDFRFIASANRNDRKDFQPLVLNPNSHPSYTPVKLNIKTANDLKLMKSKPPEKPMVPYMRYSRKVWDVVKAANPEAKLWEIGKIIGQMWRDLSDYEKQEYIGDYENAKAEYCEQIKNYHNSPQYQSFLSNATKKKTGRDDIKLGNGMSANPLISSNIINTMNSNSRLVGMNTDSVSHYAIEPAEDDGIDDSLSVRHVAANRFNRNHRLLNEIFNEYTVADNRSIVTSQRMEQLKKQVTSLELHQEKLKQELQLIEEKYELKKKKILDSSADFQNELEKLNKFAVNETQLKTFYDKHYEVLEKQWKDHVERVVTQSGTSILESEIGLENLRSHLESIISNSKAITTAPLASSITLVALHQIMEPTPAVSTNSQSNANPANIASSNTAQPAASSTVVSHPNSVNTGTVGQGSVINQSHNPYQQPPQHPQQHSNMFNQQQIQNHQAHPQQVMHGMQMQNSSQTLPNAHPTPQHHIHLQHQQQAQGQANIQTPGAHHQQPLAGNLPIQQQHPTTPGQVPQMGMAQNHAAQAMPGMHHQIVANQTPQTHPTQQQQHMPPNMMAPQNMMGTQAPTSSGEYSYPNQMAHQGYQPVYGQTPQQIQQPQQPIDQQNTNMYANQMNYPSPQQQQQYSLQQQQQYQQQMQRSGSTGPFMPGGNVSGQRLVNPSQIQSPNPNQMMMMNRPPVPNQMPPGQVIQQNNVVTPNGPNPNQAYQNFMIGQNQFNQQTQQFRSSNTPPINNPSSIVSPSQHMQPSSSSSTTSVANASIPIQQQLANNGTPNAAQSQSPIVNRIQPSQVQQQQQPTQPQMMQPNNPAQTQPQLQVRHGTQPPPGTPQQQQMPSNMNFYNPQMPQQPHMYGMVQQQQQQHFRDPNMLNQQPNQINPYASQTSGTPQPPNSIHPNGPITTASPQQPAQAGQQPQQYNMIQPNQSQPVMMQQQPNAQPNMMYAQHPQNMMYTMPQQQPGSMNPQQVIMMQQQQQQVPGQPQMMNNQYAMYQAAQPMSMQQQQQQQPPINPAGPQQPQQINNPAAAQQQPQPPQQQTPQPSTPQPAEQKTKGKKKQKTSKTSSAGETS